MRRGDSTGGSRTTVSSGLAGREGGKFKRETATKSVSTPDGRLVGKRPAPNGIFVPLVNGRCILVSVSRPILAGVGGINVFNNNRLGAAYKRACCCSCCA